MPGAKNYEELIFDVRSVPPRVGPWPVVTPQRMAQCDRLAIAGGTPGDVLMERAGAACFRETLRLAGCVHGVRFLVLAGPGNNGGDGFVVARRLRQVGADVRCVFAAQADKIEKVAGDAGTNMGRLRDCGVAIEPFRGALPAADCVVDAIFGTGFAGPAQTVAAVAISAIPRAARVLAVDIPSGVNGHSGMVDGPAVRADVTVAIQALKVGHVIEPGAGQAGHLVIADIGITVDDPDAWLADPHVAVRVLPSRGRLAHKWSCGSVLVLGGSVGMGGAPTLTAHAAERAGAGLVVAGVPAPVQLQVATALPEVMVTPLPADPQGRIGSAAFDALDQLERFGAVAIGPGLGRSEIVSRFVRDALAAVSVPVVLDADGLNAIRGDDLEARVGPTVITPHDGELRRLGCDPDGPHGRLHAAALAAEAWGVTVLLKGPSTIVATAGGAPTVCRGGGPQLATAGSGDTLCGLIAAYLARGASTHDAAVAAASVHARAAWLAAGDGRWVIASDLHAHLGAAEEKLRG